MRRHTNTSDLPDFLLRSTLSVAFVSVLLLTPFAVNNFIQGRYILGVLTLFISVLCTINAWTCYKGQYNLVINLFGIAPAISITIVLATHELGVAGSYWAFLVALAFYSILPEKLALIANIIFAACIIPVAWSVLEHPVAVRFSSVLLGISFFAFLSMNEITRQHYLLKGQAITDALTGLYNRSLLEYSLEHAIKQSRRTGTAITLMMIDIDNFKNINDDFGHEAGDSVLKSLAEVLTNNFRGSDMIFRIGGEEFLVLIHNTDELHAIDIAEKLRIEIEQLWLIPGHTVTVSMGVTGIQPDMGWKELMKHCDEKLYRAKSNGKNQVFA